MLPSFNPASITMPLQPRPTTQGKGLCLLSLDAGGSRAISQLKILAELMLRLNHDAKEDEKQLPCDVFDMIGGTGSGGFIAILLVVLELDAQQALEEFTDLSVNILDVQGIDAGTRTAALEKQIDGLLKKYGIGRDRRLLDSEDRSGTCKLVVPVSYKSNVGASCILRNFETRQEKMTNLTIAQALQATIAIPPLFTSTSITKDSATFEYISEDLPLSNPTQKMISEACHAFGPEELVACLLSVGCGHTGIISAPNDSNLASWNQFLEKLVTRSEQEAQRIDDQIGHLGIYHRLYVAQGLQSSDSRTGLILGDILAHTTAHLSDPSVSRTVELCINSLKIRDGVVSLDQLKHSGGQAVPPIPLPPLTATFVMRRKAFEFIEKAMLGTDERDGPRVLAVTGIGGCGKTQLILKFISVHKSKFRSTFFIDGSSEPRIRADILRHVRSLGTAHSQKSFEECLLLLSQPTSDGPRLLVYDNVDDPGLDLLPLLPRCDSSAVIITSRNRSIGALSLKSHLELDKMTTEEAVELLLSIEPDSNSITEQARGDAVAIAEALGCLPIALQQACSYIYHTKCSKPAYLERLSDSRHKLLAQPAKYQKEMRYLSTYAAFNASFKKLPLREQKMLRLLSFLHWSKFPLELIILAAKHKFSEYQLCLTDDGEQLLVGKALLEEIFLVDGTWNSTNLDELVVSLQNHSLVTLVAGVGTTLLEMHPLLHGWLKSNMPQQEQPRYQAASILLVALGHREDYTPSTQYLASHIAHLSDVWDQLHINNRTAFGLIMRDFGLYVESILLLEGVVSSLRETTESQGRSLSDLVWLLALTYQAAGRLKEAMVYQEEVLKLRKEISGGRDLETITASSNLALTYCELGRLKEAEVLQEEVLKLRKELLGEHHPDTIDSSNNLALTYRNLGRLKEAEALQEEVLELKKELLGDRHPDTITVTSNLALIYCDLGRPKEAEVLQEEVLKLRKELLGEHHPDTITAASNLALTYRDLGRLKEAEVLQEGVMKLRKELLGGHHPDTITAASNLALTYCDLGRLKEAEVLQEEALKLRKELLGEHHPDTISASNNLANTYCDLGRLKEGEVLQEEVLDLRKGLLGRHHPDTITAASNLAVTYRDLGRLKEAGELQEEVLELSKELLGHRHPNTITAASNLVLTYCDLGRLKEAEVLQEEVLELRTELLGGHHPDTITAASNLALTYCDLGRPKEAEVLQEEVLKLRKELLGEHHPDTTTAASNLALTYCDLGRLKEAGELQEEVLELRKELLGDRHPETITASSNLANTYYNLGRLKEAEVLQEEAMNLRKEILGEMHPGTCRAMLNLAKTYADLEKHSQAADLLSSAEAITLETVSTSHPLYLYGQEVKSYLVRLSSQV